MAVQDPESEYFDEGKMTMRERGLPIVLFTLFSSISHLAAFVLVDQDI